jgi:hypothetical protein
MIIWVSEQGVVGALEALLWTISCMRLTAKKQDESVCPPGHLIAPKAKD